MRLSEANNTALFYYNALGQLVQQDVWQENGTLEQCAYEFDANGNRTKLTLPNNDEIRYFYYGTGHLSAIKYNDKLITEIKRDARHQEIEHTQGELKCTMKILYKHLKMVLGDTKTVVLFFLIDLIRVIK